MTIDEINTVITEFVRHLHYEGSSSNFADERMKTIYKLTGEKVFYEVAYAGDKDAQEIMNQMAKDGGYSFKERLIEHGALNKFYEAL